MKKLKWVMVLLVVFFMAFMPLQIKASEITTEPITTEETTVEQTTEFATEVVENEPIDLVETLNKAKTWLMAGIVFLLSNGVLSIIGAVYLNKLKLTAFEQIDLAKSSNKISQDTADKATQIVESGVDRIEVEIQTFENNVASKMDDLGTDMKTLIEKFDTEFMSVFRQALVEYLSAEEGE